MYLNLEERETTTTAQFLIIDKKVGEKDRESQASTIDEKVVANYRGDRGLNPNPTISMPSLLPPCTRG